MRSRRPQDPAKSINDIKSGLSALAERLDGLMGLAAQSGQNGGGTASKTGEFKIPVGDKTASGVFGVTVRMGLNGPQADTFGNFKPGQKSGEPEVSDIREPLVDVFVEQEEILITAEMPGVKEDEITVSLTDDILQLATTGGRKFGKEILVESPVVADSLSKKYQNGILEIRLKRADP